MTTAEKRKILLDRLIKKTENGQLDWEEEGEKEFGVVFGDYVISIKEFIEGYSSSVDYSLSITDESGKSIERFFGLDEDNNKDIITSLGHLYQLARESALKVDEKLDALIEQLA